MCFHMAVTSFWKNSFKSSPLICKHLLWGSICVQQGVVKMHHHLTRIRCLPSLLALKGVWLLMATDCVCNKDGTAVTHSAQ